MAIATTLFLYGHTYSDNVISDLPIATPYLIWL